MSDEDNIAPMSEAALIMASAEETNDMFEEARKFTASISAASPQVEDGPSDYDLTAIVKKSAPSTKETKASIISSIMRLEEVLKIPNPRPESHWNRMNKPELAQRLADLQTMGHDKLNGTIAKIEQKAEEVKAATEDLKDVQQRESFNSDIQKLREANASTLFWIQFIAVKCAESITMTNREKWALQSDLEHLGDDVIEDREEIEKALAEIYEEHKQLLDPILSGSTKYAAIMMGLAIGRYGKNAKYKKT